MNHLSFIVIPAKAGISTARMGAGGETVIGVTCLRSPFAGVTEVGL
jgi:hypothetical protein